MNNMADINKLNAQTIVQTLTGYDRAIYINFKNDTPPSVSIEHERVFRDEDGEFHHKNYLGMLTKQFHEGGSFQLYNPLTDEPLGATMTHEYLQVVLYSLYRSLAVADTETPSDNTESPVVTDFDEQTV